MRRAGAQGPGPGFQSRPVRERGGRSCRPGLEGADQGCRHLSRAGPFGRVSTSGGFGLRGGVGRDAGGARNDRFPVGRLALGGRAATSLPGGRSAPVTVGPPERGAGSTTGISSTAGSTCVAAGSTTAGSTTGAAAAGRGLDGGSAAGSATGSATGSAPTHPRCRSGIRRLRCGARVAGHAPHSWRLDLLGGGADGAREEADDEPDRGDEDAEQGVAEPRHAPCGIR